MTSPDPVARLHEMCRQMRPPKIESLWCHEAPWHLSMEMEHLLAQNIDFWAKEDEVSALLGSKAGLQSLVNTFYKSSTQLGQYCEIRYPRNDKVELSSCAGCNTIYDSARTHPSSPSAVRVFDEQVKFHLHMTVLSLWIICQLLAKPAADNLVLVLAREKPAGTLTGLHVVDWIEKSERAGKPIVLPSILGLLDNCSTAFPRASQLGAALLSLVICRRPAVAFSIFDPDFFIASVSIHLRQILRLVHNSECLVEERCGVVAFLNLIPALYHLGSWSHLRNLLEEHLVFIFTAVMINICHSATQQSDGERVDQYPDLVTFPELISEKVLVESLLCTDVGHTKTANRSWRIELLRHRPLSCAVAAALEVLGWWAIQGVDLSRARIPVTDADPITVSEAVDQYMSRIQVLIDRAPKLDYMGKVASALVAGTAPSRPTRTNSLLYGPLTHTLRRCGLTSCRRRYGAKGESGLFVCSGGCGGLEHYCCQEHQKKHWKYHKEFCKKNVQLTCS